MGTLYAIYIALAVFGVGVTIVDMVGALDRGSEQDGDGHGGGHDGGHGHDAGHSDGHGGGHDGGHGHDAGHSDGHDASQGHDAAARPEASSALAGGAVPETRSSAGEAGVSGASRIVAMLRIAVFFSLGAGPTGIVALLRGLGAAESLAWSAGAGAIIAVAARLVRGIARRELDSTVKPEELIMEKARIIVPVTPGFMGKAELLDFGARTEVFVRALDPTAAFARGKEVRIIDIAEDCYLVEAAETLLPERGDDGAALK